MRSETKFNHEEICTTIKYVTEMAEDLKIYVGVGWGQVVIKSLLMEQSGGRWGGGARLTPDPAPKFREP